jgi:hypothetical protein
VTVFQEELEEWCEEYDNEFSDLDELHTLLSGLGHRKAEVVDFQRSPFFVSKTAWKLPLFKINPAR